MDDPGPGQCFTRKGWDDAPHLDEDTKARLLESYPEHQRDMRTKGLPMLGHGRIYDLSEEFITCAPFEIPDHWLLINGLDFGYDHPQAVVQLAIDMDQDCVYLTHCWKCAKVSANEAWGATKAWAEDVPTAWPHDGLQHEKGRDDAKQQKDHYQEAGFQMLADHATWDGKSNSVEQGLYELRERMQTGRFKSFRGCRPFFDEFLQYHRDDKGKIVKTQDDVLDSCFHPDTKIITDRGLIKISELSGTSGRVLSIGGKWEPYTHCTKTRENTKLIEITFSDGYRVKCTPDHRFLTISGWIRADRLHGGEVCRVSSITTEESTQSWANTTDEERSFCTGKYGKMPTGLSLKSTTYTTLMAIPSTTIFLTWSALKAACHLSRHHKGKKRPFPKAARVAVIAWQKSEEGQRRLKALGKKNIIYLLQRASYTCEQCGYVFIKKVGKNRFCSNKCKAKFYRESGQHDETRICPWCLQEYQTNKYSGTGHCSRSCDRKHWLSTPDGRAHIKRLADKKRRKE